MSRRAGSIFKRSEPQEKRIFLNYLLQNPTVDGKKLEFTLRKPFNLAHELAVCPNWLSGLCQVRTPLKSIYADHFAVVRRWNEEAVSSS